MRLRWSAWVCSLIGCLALCWSAGAAITLTPIPFEPRALSGDGTTVYGTTGSSLTGVNLRRWTAADGAQTVFTFPINQSATVWSVSDDGNTVGGTLFTSGPSGPRIPFIWRASTGLQTFPTATGTIRTHVSDDGNAAISSSDTLGPQSINGYLLVPGPVAPVTYLPRGIGADGSIVGAVGFGNARRVVNGTVQEIEIPGAPDSLGVITAITPDGTCVGYADGTTLFFWKDDDIRSVSTTRAFFPTDTSADARVIVGHEISSGGSAEIWIDGLTYRIRDYLIAQGVDVSGFSLFQFDSAWGISHDGTKFISGRGTSSNSGYLITIPEPSSLALLAFPAFALSGRRRPRVG